MKIILGLLAAALAASGAHAADAPEYRPQGAWVKPVAIPKSKPEHEDGEGLVLLQDVQTRFGQDKDEYFRETAVKLLTAKGLSDGGNLILSWRPDTETLVIHKLQILRGDQVIDLLAGGKTFTVLRRETNLEMAMLDGTLTATLQPEGLQIGDTVDMAYTLQSHDPVLAGRSGDWAYLARPGVVGHAHFRSIWPKNKPMRWRSTEGLAQGKVSDTADGRELVFDMTDVEAPHPPQGAPLRFGYMGQLQLSDFASWAEVSTLSAPLYEKASTLAANSPLRAEADKIKAASSDPKARAMAALKLVEDKVRYLYLGLNNGGYVPADADVTWTRRFGDCKAKTVLLLALLRELGIEAHPTLVNTEQGDGLDQRLPSMDAFDHVVVRATIGGKAYWMDGTRIGDTRLDDLATPNFYWTLPVQASGGALEKLQPTIYPDPLFETRLTLDASAGLDMPAGAHVEHIFRGASGLGLQLQLESVSKGELDRNMRTYWRKVMPWIEPKQVVFSRNEAHDVTLSMDGAASMNWSKDSDGRDFFFDDSTIGYNASFQREPGPNKDAPFAIGYPAFIKRTVRVTLPGKGKSFLLMNSFPVDKVVAGVAYHRASRLEDGVAVIEMSQRSIGPEFLAAEAPAAAQVLRDWANHSVALRQNEALAKVQSKASACLKTDLKACETLAQALPKGGVQQAGAFYQMGELYRAKAAWDQAIDSYSKAIAAKPDMAEAYAQRGSSFADKGQVALAIKDLEKAVELDPRAGYAWSNLGFVQMASAPDKAIADFDKALEINPRDVSSLVDRGLVYRAKRDWTRALADFDAAIKIDPHDGDAYGGRAATYYAKGDYAAAVQEYTLALRENPGFSSYWLDRGLAYRALNDADKSIKDFDEAIRLDPADPQARAERERQEASRLDAERKSKGCDAVLNSMPNDATCLVQRGYAASAKKDWAAAIRDYTAALKASPHDTDAFRKRGFVYQSQGRLDLALDDYNQSLRVEADAATLRNRGLIFASRKMWSKAIEDYNAAINASPGYTAAYISRGLALWSQGDLDKAIDDYGVVLKATHADALRLTERGRLYAAKRDWAAAITDFTAAIKANPDYAMAYVNRGLAYSAQGQQDLAIQDDDQALRLGPGDPVRLRNRALAYAAKKDWPAAITDLDAALKAKPDYADAYNSRGFVYQMQAKFEPALKDYDNALRLDPAQKLARMNRAHVFLAKGRTGQAIEEITVALRLDPANASYYAERGRARLANHQVDLAFKDMDEVVRLLPSSAAAFNLRCWSRATLGKDLDMALADCDAAVKLAPEQAGILDSRGFVYFRLGAYDKALADLDAALKVNPKLAPSLYIRGLVEQRMNRTAQAEADIAGAKILDPVVAETYAGMGVGPTASAAVNTAAAAAP